MSRYASMEHLRFLLFEVHKVNELFQYPFFSHLDDEQVSLMIDSAKALADRDMYPYFKEMDEQPVRYTGRDTVWTHPQLKTIIQEAAAQSWIGGSAKFEHGGLQLPEMVYNAGHHLFQAANNGTQGYLALTTGSARLITTFGSQALIDAYVPHLFEGRWQGTMALTEPQAGSSLTDITTAATPTGEGYYHIKGQKIFISAGQHLACDNFVHLTLARIEGAPAGVKGISLFVVPKYRPEGTDLTYNDVFCAGDFQKMGQRAYATTHLVYGERGDCRGWLVGEANKGLTYMFQMMNEARIGVGLTAASVSMAAYYAALQYAQERPQGRRLGEKDPSKPPIPIIQHADVQRMLLTQKAIVEGALSLAMACNKLADMAHAAEGAEQRNALLLLEILTPIIKTYASEQGNRSTSLAIQVFGGYGYTVDFPAQQYYRDLRIMALYEGTTGIQSLDLLGRKLTLENGKAFQLLVEAMSETIAQAAQHAALQASAATLQTEVQRLQEVAQALLVFAQAGALERFTADATVFMDMASHVVIAWQWLKQALVAQHCLGTGDFSRQSQAFYEGRLHTMRFFFRYELPHAAACAKTLMDADWLTNLDTYDTLD